MSTRFEHRATYAAPASTVYQTLVDRAFLDERLKAVGGKVASVVDYTGSGDAVAFKLRQGIDANRLPGAVSAILKGDLVVEREERWQLEGGTHTASSRVSMSGVPGEITSKIRIADRGDGGSEVVTAAEARVSIPLIGGKLEGVIAEQVGKLLSTEADFTGKWLAEHGS